MAALSQHNLQARRLGMHGAGLHTSRCVLRAAHALLSHGALARRISLGGWARVSMPVTRCPEPMLPSASAAGLGALSDDEGSSSESGIAVDSAEAAAKLARRRAKLLKPYLMPSPKRGIIGTSKYAERLRKQIVAAARDTSRRPVMVFGESGLEKSNIAALVHFSGPGRSTNLAALDCARLDWSGAELFGRGDKEGIVEAIGDGTLLLKNVHKLPPSLLPRLRRLLAERTYRRATTSLAALGQGAVALSSQDLAPEEALPPLKRAACRILMTASKQVPNIDGAAEVIKVPPLRLRPADVKDLQRYYLRELARRQGSGGGSMPRLSITDAALKQLESYNWPGNQVELANTVERAVLQQQQMAAAGGAAGKAAGGGTGEWSGRLSEEVFWVAKQAKDRLRLNLLAAYPPLRSFLRSELWPNDINFKFTAYVYPVVVALLLWGPQDRLHSPSLAVFWDYWWPLVFVSFPLLGRVWCAVCPFMIYGELVQKWRTSGGAELLKWPKEQAEAYGPPFLFSLFAAILMWEEVWDLPNNAALSGWLLIIITAGAVVCSSIFERRLWCRYLCPIGGMNGMFAKLSMTEVRARHGVCASECSTYHCYKGGCAQPPVGLESPGCPLYSHPAQLTDNRNCTNCMECLKACPNGSVEVRLRLPGTDLWSGHTASVAEVSLMFMLLGAVYLHHLPQLVGQAGLDASALGLTAVTPQHIATSFAVLFAPGLAAWGADVAGRAAAARGIDVAAMAGAAVSGALSRISGPQSSSDSSAAGAQAVGAAAAAAAEAAASAPVTQPAPFVELAYGYLPLVWAATLAHYLPDLLGQGGHILQIAAASVGFEDAPLPAVEAHPSVIAFLQGTLLLFGAGTSGALSRKLAAAPWSAFLPQLAGISLLTAELWALLLP